VHRGLTAVVVMVVGDSSALCWKGRWRDQVERQCLWSIQVLRGNEWHLGPSILASLGRRSGVHWW
jgi:hypothetical protein